VVGAQVTHSGSGISPPAACSGGTPARFAALADWAARDLSMARVLEGHADALAILGEAGLKPEAGADLWGVGGAATGRRHDRSTDHGGMAPGRHEALLLWQHSSRTRPCHG